MLSALKSLVGSRYPMLVLRMGSAIACFLIAVVLSFVPGPAFVFWILGLILLGYGAGEILLSLEKVQAWLHRHVPLFDRLPRFHRGHTRMILRNRWVRYLDRLSASRLRRRLKREQRRAERRATQSPPQ